MAREFLKSGRVVDRNPAALGLARTLCAHHTVLADDSQVDTVLQLNTREYVVQGRD